MTTGPGTDAVHGGERPDPTTGALNTPVYRTSTFRFDTTDDLRAAARGERPGFYTRHGHPNFEAVETKFARLHGAPAAVLFGSGMAALAGILLGAREDRRPDRRARRPLRRHPRPPRGDGGAARDPDHLRPARRRSGPRRRPARRAPAARRESDQPDAPGRRPAGPGGAGPRGRAPSSPSTTRSPPRSTSARSRTASTSSGRARRRRSAGTATCSPGWSPAERTSSIRCAGCARSTGRSSTPRPPGCSSGA